jgi:hypothetical protein
MEPFSPPWTAGLGQTWSRFLKLRNFSQRVDIRYCRRVLCRPRTCNVPEIFAFRTSYSQLQPRQVTTLGYLDSPLHAAWTSCLRQALLGRSSYLFFPLSLLPFYLFLFIGPTKFLDNLYIPVAYIFSLPNHESPSSLKSWAFITAPDHREDRPPPAPSVPCERARPQHCL